MKIEPKKLFVILGILGVILAYRFYTIQSLGSGGALDGKVSGAVSENMISNLYDSCMKGVNNETQCGCMREVAENADPFVRVDATSGRAVIDQGKYGAIKQKVREQCGLAMK